MSTAILAAGPGWFTSVMGTGILAITLTVAPVQLPIVRHLGAVLFAIDVAMFVGFTLLWTIGIARSPRTVTESLHDPARAQTWGAPPMACFTVAVGFLRIASGAIDAAASVEIAQALFVAGVVLSLWSAFLVPYLMFTRHELTPQRAYGSWLLPVVPPIVASVPAALLSPTWPESMRGSMLGLAYALLGLGVALAAIIIVIFYTRLLYHKIPEAAVVPTMWIVVGPLGQSVAGIIALGTVSASVWPELGHGLYVAGVAFGLLVWGFGVYWLLMALAVTVRAARKHLPFSLGWWAFTFPVGTLTSGSYGLYAATHAAVFDVVGLLLLGLLATTWSIVAVRSLRSIAVTMRFAKSPSSRLATA
ncbi:hypothetical protein [Vulcanimicrobium alpinum]|nr:hypothetical protein [Vulcanimicrobium alpinum]